MLLELVDLGFPIEQSIIYYWSHIFEMNVFCGHFPIDKNISISSDDILREKKIVILIFEKVSDIHFFYFNKKKKITQIRIYSKRIE